jgi:hypothetical protein
VSIELPLTINTLTYLWSEFSSGASSDPDELFQVGSHTIDDVHRSFCKTRKTVDRGVVRLSKHYPGTLGTEARPIGIVVHERILLIWLICDIKVVLDVIQSPSVIYR